MVDLDGQYGTAGEVVPTADFPAQCRPTCKGKRGTAACTMALFLLGATFVNVVSRFGTADSVPLAVAPANGGEALEQTGHTSDSGSPHIVLLVADDMGYNDLGYSSSDLNFTTPNIDWLAENGRRLTRYYTQSSCTPARGALLTGRYPFNVNMGYDAVGSFGASSPWGLPLNYSLLPQHLAELGYSSHLIGKWGVGHHRTAYLPSCRGFDSFVGYMTDAVTYYSHDIDPALMGQAPIDLTAGNASAATATSTTIDPETGLVVEGPSTTDNLVTGHNASGEYSTDLFARWATAKLRTAAIAGAAPHFLYVSFQAPHAPLDAPPHTSRSAYASAALGAMTNEPRKLFAKMLMTLDDAVGDIAATLDSTGLAESTILIFVSDNGGCPYAGGSNYPLRGGKFDAFEGGVRVPGVIYAPAYIKAEATGLAYEHLFHVTDLLPTLLSAADYGKSAIDALGLDGIDQWSAIKGKDAAAPRTEVVLQMNRFQQKWPNSTSLTPLSFDESHSAMIDGEFKLVMQQTPSYWCAPANDTNTGVCGITGGKLHNFLFNLTADPSEETNLYTNSQYFATAERLEKKLKKHYYTNSGHSAWRYADTDNAVAIWRQAGYVVPWKSTLDSCS